VVRDLGDRTRRNVLIARVGHLQRRRQVCPELESVHTAVLITLRHFLMKNAAACRHPLHVARGHFALIAQAVAVLDGTRKHVGDRLNPPVWMPGKSLHVVFWTLIAEIIQQQERIELFRLAKTEGPLQLHAGAFDRWGWLNNLFNWS